MISKFFIERPVLSNVIALLMILIGGVALFELAIAQYPDVVPPTVQVTTRYPGASAKTVIDTVALPIEQQVNGVEDMLYMQSYSAADGTYSLTVTFKIGTDLNFAQVLVQNRVASAMSSLPQSVQNQGVQVQKRSNAVLLFVTLTSPDARFDSLYLSNYATINLKDETLNLRLQSLAKDGNRIVARFKNDYDKSTTERRIDQVIACHGSLPADGVYFELKAQSRNRGEIDYDALIARRPQARAANPDGKFQLFRVGDAVASRNIHAALYDSLRLCSVF